MNAEAPRRFYKEAAVSEDAAGFGIKLDARALKTPAQRSFLVQWRALAEACAAEWAAQGERILPASMPLTQLAFAAIDHTPSRRAELGAHIAKYAETDLVSHRAETPAGLVERQSAVWDPLLVWADADLGLTLPVVTGIIAAEAPTAVIAKMRGIVEGLDDYRLTALAHATELAGSAVIALALTHGRIDGARAYAAATVDENWSLERWGEDSEARTRLDRLRAELEAVERFVSALSE